jgi:hypothetical protein
MAINVLNTDAGLSGKTLVNAEDAQTVTGLKTYDRDPNPPFAVASGSAVVPNLDADKLDGVEGASFVRSDADDTITGNLTLSAGSVVLNDNIKLKLGTGVDAEIYYDGTDLIINTAAVGSGGLSLPAGKLRFPAVQSSSGDANTLDDYREGAWTPVIGGSGGTSGQAYSFQQGFYVKIGRLVYCEYFVVFSAKGTITGNAQLQNLPFTSAAQSGMYFNVGRWANLATSVVNVALGVQASATVADIFIVTAAAVSSTTQATTANLGNTSEIRGAFCYMAAN